MNNFNLYELKNTNSKTSYSNYNKSEVKKKLNNCLKNKELDNSIYWTVELDMSGEQDYIWNLIIYFFCDYINIGNSSFIIFLYKRYLSFNFYIKKIYTDKYDYRNSLKMRNHLSELISSAVLSNYNNITKLPTINSKNFELQNHKLLCNRLDDINNVLLINDPKDIIVPSNEILFILKNNNNSSNYKQNCLFWLNWLFTWDKKFNNNLIYRKIDNIDSKYHYSIHWVIWEIIFFSIKKKKNSNLNNKIKCLFYFFKLNYKKQTQKNKLITTAILIILDNKKYDDLEFYQEYHTTLQTIMNINYVYNLVHQNKLKYEKTIGS